MTAMDVLSELKRRGVQVEAHGGLLRFWPRNAVSSDLLEMLRQQKAEILKLLVLVVGETAPARLARIRGRDAVTVVRGADVCWHCKGTKFCRCISCGVQTPDMGWSPGICVACKETGYLTWPATVQ